MRRKIHAKLARRTRKAGKNVISIDSQNKRNNMESV